MLAASSCRHFLQKLGRQQEKNNLKLSIVKYLPENLQGAP